MAKKGRPAKGKFDDLQAEFKDKVAQSTPEQILKELGDVNAYEQELIKNRDNDEDYKSKKETAKLAGETYKAGLKVTKLKRAFINQVLQDKGKVS